MTDDVKDYEDILGTAGDIATGDDITLLEYLIELSKITRMPAEGSKTSTRVQFDAIRKLEQPNNIWGGGQFIIGFKGKENDNDKRLNQLYARIICMEEKDYDPETVTNHIDELRNYIDTIIISGEWIATNEDYVRPNLIGTAETLCEYLILEPRLAELGYEMSKYIKSENDSNQPITSYAGKLSIFLRENINELHKISGYGSEFDQPYQFDRHIDDYLIKLNEAFQNSDRLDSLKQIASAWKKNYKSSYFSDKEFVEFSSSAPDTAKKLNAWIDGLIKTVETSSAINARFSIFHPSGKGRWDALGKVIGDQSKFKNLKRKVIDARRNKGDNEARKLLIDELGLRGQKLLTQGRTAPGLT